MTNLLTNSTLNAPIYPWAVQGTFILDNYISKVLGGAGLLVNLFFVVLFSQKNLKHKIYNFLWCRQFTNLIACLPLVASNGFCFRCPYSSEWLGYYTWFNACTIRACSLASFISDIFLIFYRYFEISKKTTFLKRLSIKLHILICFSFSFIAVLPGYFSVYVVEVENGTYKQTLNVFGVSFYFKLYFLLIFLIEIVIPLFTLLFMNVLSVFKFKNLMERHSDLTGNQAESKKAEDRFTKIAIVLSAITSITRLIDLFTSTLNRISIISPNTFDQGTLELISFSKSLSVTFIDIAFAFDALVYLRMDKNIWRLILSLIGLNRVI